MPDFCFSDCYQSTTPFTADAGFTDSTSGGNDFIVGIVTFKWMASVGFPQGTATTNTSTTIQSSYSVEPNFINQLLSVGKAPLSMLSGSSADRTKEIFATGRNPDSGTRIAALADGMYGVTKVVKQYLPTINGSNQVTSHTLYPIETINGISTGAAGNSGEASGGILRTYMKATLPTSGLTNETAGTTAAYYVTYLGIGDASKVEGTANGGAVELCYKGIPYSTTAIQDGTYTFWSYEHVMDRGDLASPALDVETAVVSTIQGYNSTNANISGSGLQDDTNMKVRRSGDGALVKPKFTF